MSETSFMRMLLAVSIALFAASAHANPNTFKTKHGLYSYNLHDTCISEKTINRSIDIAVDELAKSCKKWSKKSMISALNGGRIYWRPAPWIAISGSCADVPKDMQTMVGTKLACHVNGLQSGKSMWVAVGDNWGDTLTHEIAHYMQYNLGGLADIHHTEFNDGECIDVAIKAANARIAKIERKSCKLK